MTKLVDMKNIGTSLAQRMEEAGISSPDFLLAIGTKQAFLKVYEAYPDACINHLYAISGAIEGVRWHNLSDDIKADLKDFYNSLQLNVTRRTR